MFLNRKRRAKKSELDKMTLTVRLKRISGQVTGIVEMIEENRDCVDILHQIMAARSALAKVASKLLVMESCTLKKAEREKNLETLITELIKLN